MNRALILDDEPGVLAALQRTLRPYFGPRLQMDLHTDPLRALSQARRQPYDLVISDLYMPIMDGLDFLTRFGQLQPDCVRMVITGAGDFATAQRAINAIGVFRYISKPWSDVALADEVKQALIQSARQHQRHVSEVAPVAPLSPQERERRRLEALEPGITHVEWGPNGEVLLVDTRL